MSSGTHRVFTVQGPNGPLSMPIVATDLAGPWPDALARIPSPKNHQDVDRLESGLRKVISIVDGSTVGVDEAVMLEECLTSLDPVRALQAVVSTSLNFVLDAATNKPLWLRSASASYSPRERAFRLTWTHRYVKEFRQGPGGPGNSTNTLWINTYIDEAPKVISDEGYLMLDDLIRATRVGALVNLLKEAATDMAREDVEFQTLVRNPGESEAIRSILSESPR